MANTVFTKNPDGSVTITETTENVTTLFDLQTRLAVLQQRLAAIDGQIERQFGAARSAVLAQIDTTNTQITLIQSMG